MSSHIIEHTSLILLIMPQDTLCKDNKIFHYVHCACTRLFFQYKDSEEVVLWMNTVGPYHNRQETYTFFSLPYCKGPQKEIGHYHETMAEALQGVELEFSGLEISFKGIILCRYIQCHYGLILQCTYSAGHTTTCHP